MITQTSNSDLILEPFETPQQGIQHNFIENETNNNNTSPETDETSNWNKVDRRNNRKRRQLHKYIQKMNIDNREYETPYYVKFFNIKFPGKRINEDIDVVMTDDELKAVIGQPEKIVRAGYNSLQVATKSQEQTNKLMNIKELAGNPVIIEAHKTLNTVRGVVRSKSFSHSCLTNLQERLKPQGVSNIRRISKKIDNELVPTDTYVFTFNKLTRPSTLQITEWHNVIVQEYKEQPQFCYKCQGFGHVSKYCRKEEPTCARCATTGHNADKCTEHTVKCVNCEGSHYANNKSCKCYLFEQEVLATMQKEKTSKIDAREKVLSRTPEENVTFSEILNRPKANTTSRDTRTIVQARQPTEVASQAIANTITVTAEIHKAPISQTPKDKTNTEKRNDKPQDQQPKTTVQTKTTTSKASNTSTIENKKEKSSKTNEITPSPVIQTTSVRPKTRATENKSETEREKRKRQGQSPSNIEKNKKERNRSHHDYKEVDTHFKIPVVGQR